ncbi:MAG: DUF2268 domain-containing putative Zn-dependent protease [Gemmatimonadota bacterium]|jgi:uncharacterized protein YjaZ
MHRVVACLLLAGCATGTAPANCTTEFAGTICLDLSAAGSLVEHQTVIEQEVARALDAVQPLLSVTGLRISLIADPTRTIPEVGMGGFNPSTDEVQIFADPSLPNLEDVLRSELLRQLTHEVHHAMRRREAGYGSTLLQAAISEGLADHFSMEASGAESPPPWVLSLTPDEVAAWIPEVVSRSTGSYDHAAWFVGADPSIPRWTGYAVGFELVRAYLDQDPTRRASALVGEPASSFVPYSP